MKIAVKIFLTVFILSFLLNGCFSARDSEYDYYDNYSNETVIVEYLNPVVIVTQKPIIEQPKKKKRTGGIISRRPVKRDSYSSRNPNRYLTRRNILARKDRNRVEKRIMKRR